MRKYKKRIALSVAVILLVYFGLFAANLALSRPEVDPNPIDLSVLQDNPVSSQPIVDKKVYDNDPVPRSIYVTVYPGTNKYGTKTYTLADLKATTKYNLGPDEPEAYANVKVGSPDGVEGQVGYGTEEINANIKLRGHSTRSSYWKSYKLKLHKDAGLYQGQDVINLNKHPAQGSQLLNKLCFDLFAGIPDFASVNTNFVHLYIKDMSGETPDADYVDYGLYTQVEEPNEEYLQDHGLDPQGTLYKVDNFEFFRYADEIKSQLDPDYNEALFESRLGIKNGGDHHKFIDMLDAVNDVNQDINAVFDRYFDRDNYLTWMAANILVGNLDTTNQNFLLYSPTNSSKWYFLPWDYDGSLRDTNLFLHNLTYMPKTLQGMHRYMSVQLHKRMMSDQANREQLREKVIALYNSYITPERVETLVESYLDQVDEILFSEPDLSTIAFRNQEMFLSYVRSFKDLVTDNYENFMRTINYPTSFFIQKPVVDQTVATFSWSNSLDFSGSGLTYQLIVASDIMGEDVLYSRDGLQFGSVTIPIEEMGLSPGTYYVKMSVRDGLGNVQSAFNEVHRDHIFYYGVEKFIIPE